MAAVAELSFLLVALISSVHAGEQIIVREEGSSYTFNLPNNTNSCLISRSVGGEKLVLWNTSDLWSNQSSVPGPLKQRLVSSVDTSSYTIRRLTHSDSGTYREECWTEGTLTHEKNISIIVCGAKSRTGGVDARFGETVDVPCWRAAGNLDVQWLKRDFRYEQETWSRVFGANAMTDNVGGRYQVVANTLSLRASNVTATDFREYNCLVMHQQRCVVSDILLLRLQSETIYRSVEDTAVLPCNVNDFTGDPPPLWMFNYKSLSHSDLGLHNQTMPSVDQNYSLAFSSLTLNHSGVYSCHISMREQVYLLLVCPKFAPPAVELFSEGEEVTFSCRDRGEGEEHQWFIKSNLTGGRVFTERFTPPDGNLEISKLSQQHAGEYWCVVYSRGYKCVSTSRTLLVYVEPFGIYSTFFKVRCSVLSVLLLVLGAAVVTVRRRTRRGGQLSPQRDA